MNANALNKKVNNAKSETSRSFRDLTRHYFSHETKWQFVLETLLFAIIVAISAWPIISAAGALQEFLQRTMS